MLGQYCIREALHGGPNAEKYITKMERIAAKRRYGTRIGTEDSVPANDIALCLGAWYRKMDRMAEAREIVKPHMQDALIILSDDDPSNDDGGYWNFSRAFISLGDIPNATAMFNAMRGYKDGIAVMTESVGDEDASSDPVNSLTEGKPGNGGSTTSSTSNGKEAKKHRNRWLCDGKCDYSSSNCDGLIKCMYCNLEFDKGCFQLLQNDKLALNICGKDHDFFTVPTLTKDQEFKEGDTLLDGKVITIEAWKSLIKKQYGL